MEYLAITPHSHKFIFHQISEVLESSINRVNDFSAYSAACAFDALAQYAANLIAQPWRREFRQIKVCLSFWIYFKLEFHIVRTQYTRVQICKTIDI